MQKTIVFKTANSAREAETGNATVHVAEFKHIPQSVVDLCVEKYLSLMLQHKYRNGIGSEDELEIAGETLSLKHGCIPQEELRRRYFEHEED